MTLVSKKRAKEVNAAAKDRANNAGVPPGVHEMKITSVEGKLTKSEQPAIVIIYRDKDENYRPIQEWCMITGGVGEEILAQRLHILADSEIEEAETLGDLEKQISKKLLGKKLFAAIQGQKGIYKKSETEWYLNVNPKIYAVTANANDMHFDVAAKGIIELTPIEQDEWDKYMAKQGKSPSNKTAAKTEAADVDLEDDEELEEVDEVEEDAELEEITEDADNLDDIEDAIPATKSSKGDKPVTAKEESKSTPKATVPEKKAKAKADDDEEEDDLDFIDQI